MRAELLNVLTGASASIKRSETSGLVPRDLNAMFASITQFLKFQFAESMIFWTCLWSVKASFLVSALVVIEDSKN